MVNTNNKLVEFLEQAARGDQKSYHGFLELLIKADVYVLMQRPVEQAGRLVLPIFTHSDFAENWSNEKFKFEKRSFSSLLNLVGEGIWFHLNPGQEYGKEFSPWEIDELAKGAEGIPEIVAELIEEKVPTFDVIDGRTMFPSLNRLISIVEVYPEVEEAYLVATQEAGEGIFSPVVGLRLKKIDLAKLERLRQELVDCLSQKDENISVKLVEDLADPASEHKILFSGVSPFFCRDLSLEPQKSTENRIFKMFQKIFNKKKNK